MDLEYIESLPEKTRSKQLFQKKKKEMESESHCPTCLCKFSDTCALLCGHVFCPECVRRLETRAQKTNTQPKCPICAAEFAPATVSQPHPSSEYHEKLVARLDPKAKKECLDCPNEVVFFCKDGCEFLCAECQEKYHSKWERTAKHKVIPLIEVTNMDILSPGLCLLHKTTIVCVCETCWLIAEQCPTCLLDGCESNPSHSRIKISTVDYSSIKEDELVERVTSKLQGLEAKKSELSNMLKKIAQEEEKELSKITALHDEIVKKAAQIKDELTETAKASFHSISSPIESALEELGSTECILKYSIQLLNESKAIFEKENITSKLLKSKIFCEKVMDIEIQEIAPPDLSVLRAAIPSDLSVLINSKGAHESQKSFASLEKELQEMILKYGALNEEHTKSEEANQSKEKELNELKAKVEQIEKELEAFKNEKSECEEKEKLEKESRSYYLRYWRFNSKDYKFYKKAGTKGSSQLQFSTPYSVAVHPKTGYIYVVDAGSHRVQVLNEELEFVRMFGSNGSGSGQFNLPIGISVSMDGLIAVSEWNGNRIQIFDESNKVVATINTGQKKSQTCKETENFDGFSNPYYVCFDNEGNLYAANCCKNRVDKFNRQFEFERSFAQSTLGETGVSNPRGVCFTSKNQVCIIGGRVDKLKFYNTDGSFVRSLDIQKVGSHPSITEGPANTIFVSDSSATHRVIAYNMDNGEVIHTLGSSNGSNDGQFYNPIGLCFGLNQKLYVSDQGNHRIQAFSA